MHTPGTTPRRLKLSLTVGADKFELDGDHTMAEVVSAIKEWGALIGGNPREREEIRKLSQEIVDETNRDAAEVAASHVPTP